VPASCPACGASPGKSPLDYLSGEVAGRIPLHPQTVGETIPFDGRGVRQLGSLLARRTTKAALPMFMNVRCPACGHKYRVPERMLGQQAQCPACSKFFQCGSASPPSLATHALPSEAPPAVQAMPQARAADIQPAQVIHYRCPRCSKPLESAAHLTGHKVNCPDCGQRLQIPQSSTELPPVAAIPQAPVARLHPAPPPPEEEVILTVLPAHAPAPPPGRRESCLECGVDITERPRVQTCPDCGSLFCSARCYREHRYHAHPSCGR
jgi:DNA-directed RNA polymerase subunit RPC12/RpoP